MHACRHVGEVTSMLHAQAAGGVVEAARERGLIVITAGKGDVVRLVPPLIITDADVDAAVDILADVLNTTLCARCSR